MPARQAVLVLLVSAGLFATPRVSLAIEWPSLGLFSSAEPGTKDWWDDHKDDAILEPGKGYRVVGHEGYFDGDGRRMNAPTDEVVAALRERKNKPVGILPGLDPKRNAERIRTAVNGGPDQQAATAHLEEGRSLFDQQKYSQAVAACKAAAQRFPGSRIEEEALFLIAEGNFFQNRYVAARDGYNRLVSKYPSTRRIDTIVDRQWRIAKYWEEYHFEYDTNRTLEPNLFDKTRPTFDTVGQAVNTYDSIRLNDPTGPRADDSIMATASIYFRQGRYDDADYHYTLLREDYPRSELQFEAHLLGLQAKLRMYQGPDYDGTPLEDAKKLAKRIRTNFAGRLTPDEKERLRAVDAQVQRAVEERQLRVASYYDNIEQYGAARQMYAQIVDDHDGSPIAEQAAARLATIGGLPAIPEKPMARLVSLFPENRQRAKFAQIPEVRAANEATRLAANPTAAPPAPASPGVASPAPEATQTR